MQRRKIVEISPSHELSQDQILNKLIPQTALAGLELGTRLNGITSRLQCDQMEIKYHPH